MMPGRLAKCQFCLTKCTVPDRPRTKVTKNDMPCILTTILRTWSAFHA